ncbi:MULTISPECIES: protocatechuate dioxygenase [unclassified Saccharopolyspora]|uniref:protocatechuate dioxygenase n=1 Tax=unclassified Saccharopolyspora TaxID=2646250 RepID=UPI001CD6F39E|nr:MULTISPECIES: protocatechuate dioxygenase [unclassified Saccharopolyspora]MCA1188902.1 protocatechuate dioxygenase [Saccharopolyspora sp. 6T]MCA1195436.1 protocatechuate dioxygenase [Saccharopolyspora sp. 6V]MCA1227312.1 protocatechuate dioxygenase [Saccharopolyspora sp. 6M]MCA1279802.1 protocatechuate dioxygenase [Saccharopolyspora sp. 7B]
MSDHHEGQRVSRRSMFAGVGSIGLGTLLAACGSQAGGSTTVTTSTGESQALTPQTAADASDLFSGVNTCTLTPDTTQGPYYFDADKVRSDIREDRQGVRLRLALKVQDSETCAALPNAVVEIWHCDAAGLYSGAESQSSGGGGGMPPGPPPEDGEKPGGGGPGGGGGDQDLVPTDDKRYLRGAQVSNADGVVEFTTIWPGWYTGRTVHVHVMVHVSNERVLTSQLMFDEQLNSAVFARAPYSEHTGRDTFNDGDNIFEDSMLLKVVPEDDGYLASIVLSADSDQDGA